MSPPRRVTQLDVAQQVGVTQGVVSAVFSSSSGMSLSQETRERVLVVAAELGYVPKRSAPAPDTEGGTILYVAGLQGIPLVGESRIIHREYEAFYGTLTASLSMAVQEKGLHLSLHNLRDRARLMECLGNPAIRGVVWHGSIDDTALVHWAAAKLPLVHMRPGWKPTCPCDFVSVDQPKNVELAAEYLWDKGHRRIAYYGNPPSNPLFAVRREAYRRFVAERGLREYGEFLALPDSVTIPSTEKATAILDLWQGLGPEAPSALITSTVFAFALFSETRRRGLAIPDDLSLIGIDNTPSCEILHPPLTAMEQHFAQMGGAAVDLLVRRIADPLMPTRHMQVVPELLARASVKNLNGHPDGAPFAAGIPAIRESLQP